MLKKPCDPFTGSSTYAISSWVRAALKLQQWPASCQHGRKKTTPTRQGYESSYLIKYVLKLVLSQCRAFDVLDRTQLLCHAFTVFFPDRLHFLFRQLLPHAWVISQIGLGTDDEAGYARAVVVNLGEPLLSDVFEGGW